MRITSSVPAIVAVLMLASCGGSDESTTAGTSTGTGTVTSVAAPGTSQAAAASTTLGATTTSTARPAGTTTLATAAPAGKPKDWPADADFIFAADPGGQNPLAATVVSSDGKKFVLGIPEGRAAANLDSGVYKWAKKYGAADGAFTKAGEFYCGFSRPACSGALPSGVKFATAPGPDLAKGQVTITFS